MVVYRSDTLGGDTDEEIECIALSYLLSLFSQLQIFVIGLFIEAYFGWHTLGGNTDGNSAIASREILQNCLVLSTLTFLAVVGTVR